MDLSTIFVGIVLLVIAWAAWTYLPHPIGVIGGIVFGLAGLYFLLVGVLAGADGAHLETILPFLFLKRLKL